MSLAKGIPYAAPQPSWATLVERVGPDERLQCIDGADATMLMMAIGQYDAMQSQQPDLPTGVIHGDLFHDNALFNQGQLSATIDLYNASNDYLLFDVAITVNDWCIAPNGSIEPSLYDAFLNAYAQVRGFNNAERRYWNAMLVAAAMRFWLSRLETYHGLDTHQREAGVTVLKDPRCISRYIASPHATISSPALVPWA